MKRVVLIGSPIPILLSIAIFSHLLISSDQLGIHNYSELLNFAFGLQIAIATTAIPLLTALLSFLLEDKNLLSPGRALVLSKTQVIDVFMLSLTGVFALLLARALFGEHIATLIPTLLWTIVLILLTALALRRGVLLVRYPSRARKASRDELISNLEEAIRQEKGLAQKNKEVENDLLKLGIAVDLGFGNYLARNDYVPVFSRQSGIVTVVDTSFVERANRVAESVLVVQPVERNEEEEPLPDEASEERRTGRPIAYLVRLGDRQRLGETVVAYLRMSVSQSEIASQIKSLIEQSYQVE